MNPMANVKFHKVVDSLPEVLEADAIYMVRKDAGFDLYVTSHSGTIESYALNPPTPEDLGLGTMAEQNATNVAIEGGVINGVVMDSGFF